MKARAFFYVCAGIFLLALSYHLGARRVGAQTGRPVIAVAASGVYTYAVTDLGQVYASSDNGLTWTPRGNVFSGGPVPSGAQTLGQLKARYR